MSKINKNQIKNNAVDSNIVEDESLTGSDVQDGSLTNADLSPTANIALSKLDPTGNLSVNNLVVSGTATINDDVTISASNLIMDKATDNNGAGQMIKLDSSADTGIYAGADGRIYLRYAGSTIFQIVSTTSTCYSDFNVYGEFRGKSAVDTAYPTITFINDPDTGLCNPNANNLVITNNSIETMRTTENNNVLMGSIVDDTVNKLQVNGDISIGSKITFTDTPNGESPSINIVDGWGSHDDIRLNAGGFVFGVGSVYSGALLTGSMFMYGDLTANKFRFRFDSDTYIVSNPFANNDESMRFFVNNVETLSLTDNQNVVIGSTTDDGPRLQITDVDAASGYTQNTLFRINHSYNAGTNGSYLDFISNNNNEAFKFTITNKWGGLALGAYGGENIKITSAGRILLNQTIDDGVHPVQITGNTKIIGELKTNGTTQVDFTNGVIIQRQFNIDDDATFDIKTTLGLTYAPLGSIEVICLGGNTVAGIFILQGNGNAVQLNSDQIACANTDVDGKVCIYSAGSGNYTFKNRLGGTRDFLIIYKGKN